MIVAFVMAWAALAAPDPQPLARQVYVLAGPEVEFTRDALRRLKVAFRPIDRLEELPAAGQAVLVLSGKPSAAPTEAVRVEAFLREGGHVLALGGRATWMIENKLFDAKAYCPTGTTLHESGFRGYHRLTFGYPGRKPQEDWIVGIPSLVRATGGPLMELGPQATSILTAGGPFSLAAFQRLGRGLVLVIGADPQGGNAYHSLGKPTPTTGAKLGTDRLLANALEFLADPCCNLVPNSGFEENTDLPPAQSNWLVEVRGKASQEWSQAMSPEGRTFLKLTASPKSSASVRPNCPIIVERGTPYRLSFRYRATAPWTFDVSFSRGAGEGLERQSRQTICVPAAGSWQRHSARIAVPGEACAVEIKASLGAAGELCLDDVTLGREPATDAPAGQKESREPVKAFCVDFNWGPGGPNGFAPPGLWADADPQKHVDWYQKLGANVIQSFAVSCNGYAWYKGGRVPPQPGLKHDFLTELVRLGHARSMRVMGYFCVAANTRWGREHPELSYGTPSAYHLPLTNAYLDDLSAAVEESLRRTGMDGFMVDWLWCPTDPVRKKENGGRWLECERRLFESLVGRPFPGEDRLTPEETLAYQRRAIDRCWQRIRQTAKRVKPDCVLWLSCNKVRDEAIAGSALLEQIDWMMDEAGSPQALESVTPMLGPHARQLLCLVGWGDRHNARTILADPAMSAYGIYGFTRPSPDSLPLPVETYLGRPIDSFSGNDRNIAVLARWYNGKPMGYVEPKR